jgi:hypothetical protein
MKSTTFLSIAFLSLLIANIINASASTLAGVNVQKSLNIAGQTFFLRGAAVRHMGPFGTFKGYIMAVYQLQEDISKQNIPAVKSPTVLWTHSFYDLDKESLQNMFSLSFKITSTKRMLSRIRPAIHRFLEVLPAVRDGNQIIFVADPTTGVTLVRARDTQKSIRSPLLARAVLDIWLGPTPTSREFKSKLLADN